MKRLTLLRHAKSSWQQAGMDDHERPLNDRGQRDAPIMAKRLLARTPPLDHLLVSSAVRTRATARSIVAAYDLGEPQVAVRQSIYLAAPHALLLELKHLPADLHHVMLIGHNPGLEELAQQLSADAPERLPTAAAVHLELDADDFDIGAGTAVGLVFADWPKRLDS